MHLCVCVGRCVGLCACVSCVWGLWFYESVYAFHVYVILLCDSFVCVVALIGLEAFATMWEHWAAFGSI